MTWIVMAASVAVAAIAATGILRPYRRGGSISLERLSDPLDDERLLLLRALRDLDGERASGAISAEDFASLRAETELRAVAVLRALEARDGEGELAAGLREVRSIRGDADAVAGEPGPNGVRDPLRRSRGPVATLVVGAVLVLALIPLLVGAISKRAPGGSITGDTQIAGPTGPSADPQIGALEKRVADHPGDLAARLDLARRYVLDGQTGLAALAFTEALRLDPRNVEAHTGLASILFGEGQFSDALYLANQALSASPSDPEALYEKGVILLKGLHRGGQAEQAFRAYLADAPFGSHRREVQSLLAGISSSP